jgi:hypothetical protein
MRSRRTGRQPGHDVSDSKDARLRRLLRLVDLDQPAFKLDLGLLHADIAGSPGPAHGNQHLFGFLHLGLAVDVSKGHLHAGLGFLHLLNFGAGVHVDAALLEEARQFLGNFLVLDRNHARQKLDDGHLSAEGAEERAELHAHRARANDDQRLGHPLQSQNFDVGEDAAVCLQPRQHLGLGAGGQNHVSGLHVRDGFAVGDFDRMYAFQRRAGQPSKSHDPRNLVLLHQEVQALGVLGDDGVFALEHRGPIERGRADSLNAKVGGVLQVVPDLSIEEEGLGGDAAHVQAGAAQLVSLFDQCDFQPVF